MTDFEKKFKKTNIVLLNEMKKLKIESDYLIKLYELRNIRIERMLCKQINEKRRHTLNTHRVATCAKLGAVKAFKAVLQREEKSLQELSQQKTFNRDEFQFRFSSSQKIICTWANKVLSEKAPWELKHHYRPFTKILKGIGNFLLPFTVALPFAKKAIHGTFFFSTQTGTENLAKKALTKIQRHTLPAKVTTKPVATDTALLPQQEKKIA